MTALQVIYGIAFEAVVISAAAWGVMYIYQLYKEEKGERNKSGDG